MSIPFYCGSQQQRDKVRNAQLAEDKDKFRCTGIDYLTLDAEARVITLVLLHPVQQVPGAVVLSQAHLWIEDQDHHPLHVRKVVWNAKGDQATITVDSPNLEAIYQLRLQTAPEKRAAPAGYYPLLSTLDFTFSGASLPAAPVVALPATRQAEPTIDYLAKDYASFRRLMLDRLAALLPGWPEENPADLPVALVEVLAYVGDHLSYYQDAVATEAYLGTARRRISLRRHARLLDYPMHEGCNARAWVCLAVSEPLAVKKEWQFVTDGPQPQYFEPMHEAQLYPAHNRIGLYNWEGAVTCLPAGSTAATLSYDPGNPLQLDPGDVLIFEPESDPDPARRHAVRLTSVGEPSLDPLSGESFMAVEWHTDDALPFPFWLTSADGAALPKIAVARGNVLLVDHGRTVPGDSLLDAAVVTAPPPYRPHLQAGPLTCASTLAAAMTDLASPAPGIASASALAQHNVSSAHPVLQLTIDGEEWTQRPDLITSRHDDRHFVVETENDGRAWLRFGDGVYGRQPAADRPCGIIHCRLGNGRAGNVGPEAICALLPSDRRIEQVRNPLPATGGVEPEPAEQVRLYAPQAFRTQQRAVTAADYAAIAQRFPGVQRAVANIGWTGSWHTVQVVVDRQAGRAVDTQFSAAMQRYLEPYRLAGYDLEVRGPQFVPIDLVIAAQLKAGYRRRDVLHALEEGFSNRQPANGQRGLFHPDNFTFGQPVYLSRLYQAALAVAGVAVVEVQAFQRWQAATHADRTALEQGFLAIGPLEVARLDNNPALPMYGTLKFRLEGGL